MIINAVSYSRFSSNNQREASIEIQQEHINRYCKENGITIIKEYVDRAFSATSDNRPQFQQMMKDAESGMFSYVVIYNSSRFARNIQDHLRNRSILESFGVRLISVNENFDESTPEGDLMSNFMMSINQFYSKDLGRKTSLGMLESAKKCKHVGGLPPFGYSVDKDQKYVINEEEALIVKLIFNMIDDNKSYRDICSKLEELGYTKRGKKFKADFSGMIRNRKYIGEYVWNLRKKNKFLNRTTPDLLHNEADVIRIPNGMPAIISTEQFLRVNKKVAERRHEKTKSGQYLLSSMVKCGVCGYKMCVDKNINGNGKHNWTRMIYRCYSSNRRRAECNNPTIKVEYLDLYIMNILNLILLNERYSKQITKLIKEVVGKDYEKLQDELLANQNELEKRREEIKNLIASLAEAKSIAYQEIIKEIERLTLVKNDLEEKTTALKAEADNYPYVSERIIDSNIIKYKHMMLHRNVEQVKPVLKIFIDEIIVSKDKIETVVNLNAYLLGNSTKSLKATIEEEADNIKIKSNHLWQNLNWSSLNIKL